MMLGGDSGEVALACDGAEVLAAEGRSAGETSSFWIIADSLLLKLASSGAASHRSPDSIQQKQDGESLPNGSRRRRIGFRSRERSERRMCVV